MSSSHVGLRLRFTTRVLFVVAGSSTRTSTKRFGGFVDVHGTASTRETENITVSIKRDLWYGPLRTEQWNLHKYRECSTVTWFRARSVKLLMMTNEDVGGGRLSELSPMSTCCPASGAKESLEASMCECPSSTVQGQGERNDVHIMGVGSEC